VVHFEITNDIAAGTSAATAYANVVAYCTAVKALGGNIRIIVLSCISRNFGDAAKETARQTVNASLRGASSPPWDYLVDVGYDGTITVYGESFDVSGVGAAAAYAGSNFLDGVHPNRAGHTIIAGPVRAAINGLAAASLAVDVPTVAEIAAECRISGVKLADGVAHGGTTATIDLQYISVSNPSGIAASFTGQGTNGHGIYARALNAASGVYVQGTGTGGTGMHVYGRDDGLHIITTVGTGINVEAAGDDLTASTKAEIADAVWDEVASGHTTAGTFGKLADNVLKLIQSLRFWR
jgi:hypothetical protein